MESSIAQSIHKGFEKEKWEIKGYSFFYKLKVVHSRNGIMFSIFLHRNGCSTSEDLFWKLDALQSFIHDLHWPDTEFARHLEQRLKLMACDMIDSCIQRYVYKNGAATCLSNEMIHCVERITRSSSGWKRELLLPQPITYYQPNYAQWLMLSWMPNNNHLNFARLMELMW